MRLSSGGMLPHPRFAKHETPSKNLIETQAKTVIESLKHRSLIPAGGHGQSLAGIVDTLRNLELGGQKPSQQVIGRVLELAFHIPEKAAERYLGHF